MVAYTQLCCLIAYSLTVAPRNVVRGQPETFEGIGHLALSLGKPPHKALPMSSISCQTVKNIISIHHMQTHTTVSRNPLYEGSVRCRNLYLTTQTFKRDKHPWPRWASSARSQQAVGRRITPYTARPLVSE
jgi:hypothetical protein